jgi:prepilin-type N-terminal cleavage/methylation domain-containing protein
MMSVSMPASFKQDGFTLLELVIAMGLFASGLLAMALLTSGLMTHNMTSRNRAVAIQLARSKIEMLRQNPYSEIIDGVERNISPSGSLGSGIFSRQVVVDENADPAFKRVTVTVSWPSKGAHRVTLCSIVAAP